MKLDVTLILKLVLVPALIGAITLAGRRWGPGIAGWLSAFPVLAAPILLFLYLDHGAAFASLAAAGTLLAVLAILVFGVSYAWAATRYHWSVSLSVAFACYLAAVAGLKLWSPSALEAAPVIIVALIFAGASLPRRHAPTSSSPQSNSVGWRMLTAAVLVVFVTRFSSQLGPTLSGMLAMFPVMLAILVAFSQRESGPGTAIELIRGAILGYYAFAAFCLVLSLTLPEIGVVGAFVGSLACAAVVQLGFRMRALRA